MKKKISSEGIPMGEIRYREKLSRFWVPEP
jgi:hypothetical protein